MARNGGDPANVERSERDDILHRKNAALLTDTEVGALRQAWEEVKQISDEARGDDRGFFEHAGLHGVPYWTCPHHLPDRLFLPWHRAYLYGFEQALQDRVPGVTLPWWDWTSTRGIPEPFDGDATENTLAGSRTLVTQEDISDDMPLIDETFRQPGAAGHLPTRDEVVKVLKQPSLASFSDALEGLHDAVHMWVNGTMGDIAYAAFDPVFWAHHCMVDRI